jgi:hypothetical protein
MHADPEQQLLVLAQGGIELHHPLLDVDRHANRRHGGGELGQHRIARRADQAAAAGLYRRPPDLGLCGLQVPEGTRLRPLHHAGEPREVGMEDGDEAALHG